VLAAAGVASRRQCEELIVAGRVEVDRQVVTQLGTRADPARQEIRVDGVALPRQRRVYYVVNKPPGVVCTTHDPAGRTRVIDLVDSHERLFTVGRLDRASEGLIIVTNDGELANQLTHPRYGVDKTYAVRVAGQPSAPELEQLRKGIFLAEGPVRVAAVQVKRRYRESTDLEIILNEGRNREIRRLLARLGHKVLTLRRIAMGSLRLGQLPLGACRKLTREELQKLERSLPRPERRERPRSSRTSPRPQRPPRSTEPGYSALATGAILDYEDDGPGPAEGAASHTPSRPEEP
jgi:23S rRNA pseudouridine2605 synthase